MIKVDNLFRYCLKNIYKVLFLEKRLSFKLPSLGFFFYAFVVSVFPIFIYLDIIKKLSLDLGVMEYLQLFLSYAILAGGILICIREIMSELREFGSTTLTWSCFFILKLCRNKLILLLSIRDEVRQINQSNRDYNKAQRDLLSKNAFLTNLIWDVKVDFLKFFNKNFSNNQSLLRFYKERYLDNGVVDTGFVFFSLLIPKKEKIPLDVLKSILINNRFEVTDDSIIYHQYSWIVENMDTVHSMFKDYSVENLKTFFTRKYHPDRLISGIYELVRFKNYGEDKTLPIFKSFQEFRAYAEVVIAQSFQQMPESWKEELNLKTSGPYQLVLLRNEKDYHTWGRYLKNCLPNLNPYFTGALFGILKNGKKFGAVEVGGDLSIHQIKGKFNSTFEDERIISKMLIIKK